MVRRRRVDEARRLLTVDGFVEVTVKKGVLHVQLMMDWPTTRDRNAEDDADRGLLDHRTENLVIVDAGLLGEATYHLARLAAGKRAVGVELVAEDPLAVTMLALGRGTSLQVSLARRDLYSSTIAACQLASMRALR